MDSNQPIALLTGGTGFIGERLCEALLKEGYTLWIYSRQKPSRTLSASHERVHCFASLEALPDTATPDVIINLAGESIAEGRWTEARKAVLKDSRIGVTELLLNVFRQRPAPQVVISGSAIGYYGVQDDQELHENSPPNQCFSHELCSEWERVATLFKEEGSRVCQLRTGVVIDSGGGTLAKLLPLFKWGVGGPMGSGKQWMSWIHRDDIVALIMFLINNDSIEGPVNATAPNPVTNREFSKTLGAVLGRPAIMPIPGFVLRLVFGQMAEELLLGGQKVMPKKALAHGFSFTFNTLEEALRASIKNKN